MRGAIYRPADTLGALAGVAAAALAEEPRALAMVYHAGLDSTGHVCGCTSDAWRFQLGHVDRLAEQLAGALPPGTAMYVTADHGMVDVGPADRVDADAQPELRDGVALLGGEPRARHVYARPGAAGDVLDTWRDTLGAAAWVVSREQAIDDGWFGPVRADLADRIGDVVAASAGPLAVVAATAEPRETALVGMHGSLAPTDQLVPLLDSRARIDHCLSTVAAGKPPRLSTEMGKLSTDKTSAARLLTGVADLAAALAAEHPPVRAGRALAAGRAARPGQLPGRPRARSGLRRPGPGPGRPGRLRRPPPAARDRRLPGRDAPGRHQPGQPGGGLRRRGLHRRGAGLVAAALLRPRPGPGAGRRVPGLDAGRPAGEHRGAAAAPGQLHGPAGRHAAAQRGGRGPAGPVRRAARRPRGRAVPRRHRAGGPGRRAHPRRGQRPHRRERGGRRPVPARRRAAPAVRRPGRVRRLGRDGPPGGGVLRVGRDRGPRDPGPGAGRPARGPVRRVLVRLDRRPRTARWRRASGAGRAVEPSRARGPAREWSPAVRPVGLRPRSTSCACYVGWVAPSCQRGQGSGRRLRSAASRTRSTPAGRPGRDSLSGPIRPIGRGVSPAPGRWQFGQA